VLYAVTAPQLLVLAVLEAGAPAGAAHAALRWLATLGLFAAMGLWLRGNRAALDLQEWCECAPEQMTVRVIESRAVTALPPLAVPEWADPERELVAR
jgi:hypothetical protein